MCTRKIDGSTVEFGTSGYTMDHVFVLYDRDTGSVWYPMSARTFDAVAGDRRGASIPFLDEPAPMPLGEWLAQHGDSEILLPTAADVEMMERLANRPYMGVGLSDGDDGVMISGVSPGTPAEEAGLIEGDVIRRMDGRAVTSREDLRDILDEHEGGDVIEVVVARYGAEITLALTLGTR